MPTTPTTVLQTFPNPHQQHDYEVRFECPEFTCLCPMTAQPDFATIRVAYSPFRRCVELKSFKLYLWSYRNQGAFHEEVTNRILIDLVEALEPRRLLVEGDFNVRGGIHTTVSVRYEAPPSPAPDPGDGAPAAGPVAGPAGSAAAVASAGAVTATPARPGRTPSRKPRPRRQK